MRTPHAELPSGYSRLNPEICRSTSRRWHEVEAQAGIGKWGGSGKWTEPATRPAWQQPTLGPTCEGVDAAGVAATYWEHSQQALQSLLVQRTQYSFAWPKYRLAWFSMLKAGSMSTRSTTGTSSAQPDESYDAHAWSYLTDCPLCFCQPAALRSASQVTCNPTKLRSLAKVLVVIVDFPGVHGVQWLVW